MVNANYMSKIWYEQQLFAQPAICMALKGTHQPLIFHKLSWLFAFIITIAKIFSLNIISISIKELEGQLGLSANHIRLGINCLKEKMRCWNLRINLIKEFLMMR